MYYHTPSVPTSVYSNLLIGFTALKDVFTAEPNTYKTKKYN